ncbi:MAG: methionyl-tRNA formyltransferase [Actinomycetota bacterium]
MARVVFLGTPRAAVPTLDALVGDHDIGLAITQPNRARGRSGTPQPPPVKERATEHGLDVAQPTTSAELADAIDERGPFDVGVVVAFGRILSSEVLEQPRHGMVNVHFSLLPRWRGAAPVARALMAGDTMTGVTIMKLDEGLDTGPIISAQAIDIPPDDDAGMLTERLATMGARLLSRELPRYLSGELKPVAQTDEGATYAAKVEKKDRPIDVHAKAKSIVDQVRGLSPSPAATLEIDGQVHKVLAAQVSEHEVETGTWSDVEGRPCVGVGDGSIELLVVQPPGKTPQSGADWLHGRQRSRGVVH